MFLQSIKDYIKTKSNKSVFVFINLLSIFQFSIDLGCGKYRISFLYACILC